MKKIKIKIRSWLNGSVLYESEKNTIKKTLEDAVHKKVDLREADLE